MSEREKFEAVIRDAIRVAYMQGYDNGKDDQKAGGGCSRYVPGNVETKLSASVCSAIAASQQAAPKVTLTDGGIMRIAADIRHRNAGNWPGDLAFARAIEAAAGPNAALVEALKRIEANQTEVLDEDLGENVLVCMDSEEMVEIARAALASLPPTQEAS